VKTNEGRPALVQQVPNLIGKRVLGGLIVTINAWNAIGVSTRAWIPGSYQP
jgi:hypothetical protein